MTPLISVLISVYNGESFIQESINSILNQSFKNFELIIVNDGSTDNTLNILNSFSDERIVIHNQNNTGLSVALNNGLRLAKGKYIARLDADDFALPNRLQLQYDFMESNPNYVLCGGFADVYDSLNNFIYTYKLPVYNNDIQEKMSSFNCIIHSTSFYKRDIALKIGGYYEPIRQYFEDYMFFSYLIKEGYVYNIPLPLISYTISPNSITSRNHNKRYDKLVRDVIGRGFIYESEKEYLFSYQSRVTNINLKTSNYHLLLARLYIIHQYNVPNFFSHLFLAFQRKPISVNLFYTIYVGLISGIKKIF
jgi:glycosyltransferase involved in cell wall biosynthesis